MGDARSGLRGCRHAAGAWSSWLFALAAPPLLVGLATLFRSRPAVRLAGRLPARLTARPPAVAASRGERGQPRATGPLSVFWRACPRPEATGSSFAPPRRRSRAEGDRALLLARIRPAPARALRAFEPGRRDDGRFRPLPHARHVARGRDRARLPALLQLRRAAAADGTALSARRDPARVGSRRLARVRRHPGVPARGIALRKIHWRSWARRGEPVVKEYQEEYFSRIALVLDTFLPRRPRPRERERFEAGDLGARVAHRPLQPQRGGGRHPGGGAGPLRGERRAKPRPARQRP